MTLFKSLRQLHRSVYIISLANGVIMTGFMMLLPLLPSYASQLGFNEFTIGVLMASFFIGRVLVEFPVGIISDYFGRRLVMWTALLLFALSTAAYALTTVAALMIAFRLVQGAASSAFVVGSQAYINDVTPPGLRGLANGVNSSAINAGVVAGPLLAGFLAQAYTIRAPFWVGGALAALCFLISLTIPGMDVSLKTQLRGISIRMAGVRELLEPLLCPPALALSMVHLFQWMGIAIFLTIAPIITANALGWSPELVAAALAASGAVSALSSPLLGQLSDHRGRIFGITAGLLVMALESLVVLLHPGTALTLAAFAVGGLAAPAYFNSFLSLIGDVTNPSRRGTVTGFVGSFGEWGGIIGSGLITPLLWHNINSGAPLIADVTVCLATAAFVVAARSVITRPLGDARTA